MAAKLNKERIVRAAEGYIRSSKFDKAVTEYEKWISANPKDWHMIRQAGDLYARINRNAEAIKKYSQIAEYYKNDGFNVRAIATYKMILRLEPQNELAMLHLADLQVAQGLMMEAKSQYQALVELYTKSAQKRRAADVFKKLTEIDPSDLKIRYKFAEFLDRQGQKDEAIAEYVGIADEFINSGMVLEAIQMMEKGLQIDGSNLSLRCKLAQASVLQGDYSKAVQILSEIRGKHPDDVELLSRLGEAYQGAGNLDEAETVYDRLGEIEPDNPEHAGRRADLAIGQGQFDRALELLTPVIDRQVDQGEGDKAAALLQKVLGKDPHHVKTLVKLAEIHTILKQEQARISAYDQLCEAYSHHGDYEKAARVAEQLTELEPENSQHKDRLKFLKSRLAPPAAAAPPSAPARPPAPAPEPDVNIDVDLPGLESLDVTDVLGAEVGESMEPELTLEEEIDLAPEVPQATEQPEDVPVLSQDDEEHIREKLTEAEVFVRYGLVDKAIDQLKDTLASFHFHTATREKLVEVYTDQGMNREAAEQAVELARVYERLGQSEDAGRLIQQAKELNPAVSDAIEPSAVQAVEEIELTLSPEDDLETAGLESDFMAETDMQGLDAPHRPEQDVQEIPVTFEARTSPDVITAPLISEADELAGTEAEVEWALDQSSEFSIEVDLDGENQGVSSEETAGSLLDEPAEVGDAIPDIAVDEEIPVVVDDDVERVESVAVDELGALEDELSFDDATDDFMSDLGGMEEAGDEFELELPVAESAEVPDELHIDSPAADLDESDLDAFTVELDDESEEIAIDSDADELSVEIPDVSSEPPAFEIPQPELSQPEVEEFSIDEPEPLVDVVSHDDPVDIDEIGVPEFSVPEPAPPAAHVDPIDEVPELMMDEPEPLAHVASPLDTVDTVAVDEVAVPEFAMPSPEPPPAIEIPQTPPAPPPAEPVLTSPVAADSEETEELEEVDEYIALGLYEDARDTLRDLLKRRPGDRMVLAKIEELGFSASQLQAEASPAGVPGELPSEALPAAPSFDAPLEEPLAAVLPAAQPPAEPVEDIPREPALTSSEGDSLGGYVESRFGLDSRDVRDT